MADLQSLSERLSELTVLEAAELSKLLETRWGVSAAAPVATDETTVAPVVEAVAQTEFSVILTAVSPDKKINVIKEVRAITNLGLKEAKEFTEAAGPTKVIKADVNRDEAESLKKRLEEAGGTAIIQ